jgi:hypothetical protein
MSHVLGPEHRSQVLAKALEPTPPNPMRRVIYHVDGTSAETYAIDARDAVTKFPRRGLTHHGRSDAAGE